MPGGAEALPSGELRRAMRAGSTKQVIRAGVETACAATFTLAGRYYGATREAEEFWQVSVPQYVLIHGSPDEEWIPFVSLRGNPLYDPRAYLSHLGERRRLARAIASIARREP